MFLFFSDGVKNLWFSVVVVEFLISKRDLWRGSLLDSCDPWGLSRIASKSLIRRRIGLDVMLTPPKNKAP